MILLGRMLPVMILCMAIFSPLTAAPTLQIPSGIDPSPWDALLKKYVDERGSVAYEKWRNDPADMNRLEAFLERYAPEPARPATGSEEVAALINAYNAFTIAWILGNYPTESIRELDDSFGGARWKIGGRRVSLDEIEHRNLRALIDWKAHAVLVCAARSCPPLRREAFTAGNLDRLIDEAYRTWLGREDLNRFEPAAKRAAISPIFKWFSEDFSGDPDLSELLASYAPEPSRSFLKEGAFQIEYLEYHWGLNDQSGRGEDYHAGLFHRLFGNAR